jgi:hypothetical protein
MSLRKDIDKLVLGLISAGFLALAGWVYSTGNRVTALETMQPGIEKRLDTIGADVKDIRNYLLDPK